MTHRHHTERDAAIEAYRRRCMIHAAVRDAFIDAARVFAGLIIALPLIWVMIRLIT